VEKNYSLNLPYPQVEGRITPKTMALLMESYSGKKSEFTGIATYVYQRNFYAEKNKNISKLLKEIFIVEMKHLELLGEAIVKFGGKPLYSGAYSFWNGSYVNYSEKLEDILKNNMQAEEEAIEDYENIIESTENDSLKKLIGRIIMDEQLHLTLFEAELIK